MSLEKVFPDFTPADTHGVSRTGEFVKLANLSQIYRVRLSEGSDRKVMAAELSSFEEGILFAEPNGMARPTQPVYPNDPKFDDPANPGQGGSQWNLLNTGQSVGIPDADIDAPEAWEITTGSATTKIAIIDGGVDNSHQDLGGKVSGDAGWGWNGHGFNVAGIAAAKTNNSKGIAGVDWNAQLISQRIDNTDDGGITQAIYDAIDSGAHILNNSWELEYDKTGEPKYSIIIRLAFADAYKLNLVATAGMGNEGIQETDYPAGFGQGIIAVGATTRRDQRWEGSNIGSHIDVSAPGSDIWTCDPWAGLYYHFDGTSVATPHVSGIAGLLLAYNPNLYNDDIEQIIRISAEDVNSSQYPGWDPYLGTGRVNARLALDKLRSPYMLNHWSAPGGTAVGSYPISGWFYGIPNSCGDGWYTGRKYEVRKNVTFPHGFSPTPYVWGRGVATKGYSGLDSYSRNYTMGWCEVVPGSITPTGCTLRTYVYSLSTPTGGCADFYPDSPENVNFAYTVLGTQCDKGDVNCDGEIDELDLYRAADIILEIPPPPTEYELWAADCNDDGEIDVLDLVCISNLIQGGGKSLAWNGHVEPAEVWFGQNNAMSLAKGSRSVLPIIIKSDVPIAGMQMEIELGSKAVVPVDLQTTSFTDEMTLRYSIKSDRVVFVMYSEHRGTFGPGSGIAVEIIFELEDSMHIPSDPNFGLEFGDILLANTNAGIIPLKPRAEAEQDPTLPQSYTLSQNYPNPFNPTTTIQYSIPSKEHRAKSEGRGEISALFAIRTTLNIYNILGQEIRTLVDEPKDAGYYTVTWDGKDSQGQNVSSGVYFYRLQTENFVETKKMVLMR